jgi:metallo-beta-lactamase class B
MRSAISLLILAAGIHAASAQKPAGNCDGAGEWNDPQAPFRIYGNTYYVGTHCLAAILITSPTGHVLVDGALPASPPMIRAHIEALGFRMTDVKLIVNSHVHYDHAGGIAELQAASGAAVAASPASARVLEAGESGPDDPQYGILPKYRPVKSVRVLAERESVRVGTITITPHWTPGHTPGGTTWTWKSCEESRCLSIVYADSQTPVSADTFRYTNNKTYPAALDDFARGQATLEKLECDILLTPHPGASSLWERVANQKTGGKPELIDRDACRQYAARGRAAVAQRVAKESAKP